jgi:hypothetical protein
MALVCVGKAVVPASKKLAAYRVGGDELPLLIQA